MAQYFWEYFVVASLFLKDFVVRYFQSQTGWRHFAVRSRTRTWTLKRGKGGSRYYHHHHCQNVHHWHHHCHHHHLARVSLRSKTTLNTLYSLMRGFATNIHVPCIRKFYQTGWKTFKMWVIYNLLFHSGLFWSRASTDSTKQQIWRLWRNEQLNTSGGIFRRTSLFKCTTSSLKCHRSSQKICKSKHVYHIWADISWWMDACLLSQISNPSDTLVEDT